MNSLGEDSQHDVAELLFRVGAAGSCALGLEARPDVGFIQTPPDPSRRTLDAHASPVGIRAQDQRDSQKKAVNRRSPRPGLFQKARSQNGRLAVGRERNQHISGQEIGITRFFVC